MASPCKPEPKFFLVDDLYERGLDYYSDKWFAAAGDQKILGEKSTNYLENPKVASRIRSLLPNAKLVFILRDPVKRAYSNYCWSKMNGLETDSFAGALELEESRQRRLSRQLRYSRPHAYFSRGLYAKLLKPYFDLFPRRSILCLCYEDIAANREQLVERFHRFVGASIRTADGGVPGRVNASSQADTDSMPEESACRLREAYQEPNRALFRLLGEEFKSWESI